MQAADTRANDLREPKLKAAIIYDDFDFAARTVALLERAAARSDEVIQWDVKPWRLDFLKPSLLAEAALVETADVDLIVVTLSKTHLLPDTLLDWLERWAGRRQNPDAAVMVLCPEEAAGPLSSWSRLKEFAAAVGLPFLGNHNLEAEGTSLEYVQRLGRQKQPLVPRLSWSAEPPASLRHWGINE